MIEFIINMFIYLILKFNFYLEERNILFRLVYFFKTNIKILKIYFEIFSI